MENLRKLKTLGNKQFAENNFRAACTSYGQAVSDLMSTETELVQSASEAILEEISQLKITLFLNLAAANLKLGSSEGCRRCTNTSLVFCNKPSLLLSDLGIEDDITEDTQVLEPVTLPRLEALMAKALYRRGQSYVEELNWEKAIRDFEHALRFAPGDSAIRSGIELARKSQSE